MAFWDWSDTADSNTTVDGININNNCPPGNIDNGLRAVMAGVKAGFTDTLKSFLLGSAALPIAKGGTGQGTAAAALAALGGASAADVAGAIPAGLVAHFAMTSPPTGWLVADGSAVSRSTYGNLFSAIGIIHGAGNGSSTFNLPDLRGEFIRGWDGSRGVDSGRGFGSAQADDLKSHTHPISMQTRSDIAGGGSQTVFGSGSSQTGATGGTETRPRNVALLACIKY